MVNKTLEALESDAQLQKEYEAFAEEEGRPKGQLFVKKVIDGKVIWDSPYKHGKSFIKQKSNAKSFPSMVSALNVIFDDLGRVDPEKWTDDMVISYLNKLPLGVAKARLIRIRNLVPQYFMESGTMPIGTGRYTPAQKKTKHYDLFFDQVMGALKYIENQGYWYFAGLHQLHVCLGCREGITFHERDVSDKSNGRGGLLGLMWKNLDPRAKTLDVFEGKTKGGILWQGCPLYNFGWNMMPFLERVRELKEPLVIPLDKSILPAGEDYLVDSVIVKPSDENIINIKVQSLGAIYKYINAVYHKLYAGKYKFDRITAHTARHLHVNLLFENEVPSHVICGNAKRGEGYVGVGWETKDTMETYYLTLARRKLKKYLERASKSPHDLPDAGIGEEVSDEEDAEE